MGTPSILLIGLRSEDRAVAERYFGSAGHAAVSSDSHGDTAVATALSPDVVYFQPPDSERAIEQLKELRLARAAPVVLVCRAPSAATILEAWRAGAADVIEPPLTPDSLGSSLQRALASAPAASKPEAAQARLRHLDENGKERWSSIVPPKFTIGRSSNNDLVVAHLSVSRVHAEIRVQDGDYWIYDLGSKHGTYLNGAKLEKAKLTNGDRIQVGGLQGAALTFHKGDLLQSLLSLSDSRPEASLPLRDFREIGMLLATFRALSSIPLLDDLLSLVVDTAIELTGAERGFIMLAEKDGSLRFRCARNSYKQPLDGSFFTSRRVPEKVFATGERAVINDLDVGDSGDHSSTRRLGLRSIFCVPLRYLAHQDAGSMSGFGRTEIIGVLYVDSQNIGAGLSNTQVEALETLASEAAMAIYNARLYKESQEKRKLDEELGIAREIQQALLPQPNKTLPFASAYSQNLPCREVGGDYFDYFELEDGRFGFALGDVAGKGMPAALLLSMLQGIFSAQTLAELPLPEMMSNVNAKLARRGTGNRFVTFFFGILDSAGVCTYTNAGHNPPLLLHRDGSMEELIEGGLVLGIFPAAQYRSGTAKLEPGEHIVLFTDGVIEARNTAGEEFGEERLRDLLRLYANAPAAEILSSLQNAVSQFSANTPQHDDITMMVIERSRQ
jgi:serine phosphatase RsbU (regulator of sigma subunit)